MEKTLADVKAKSRDIAEFTRALQDYFLHQQFGTRKNLATPRFVLPLLVYLEEMTPDTAPEGQTKLDLIGWKERLAEYRKVTEAAPIDDGNAIEDEVTGPLLLGWWEDEENQKMLDAVTPIRIMNTIQAETEAMDEAWARLIGDLTKSYGDALEAAGKATEQATGAASKSAGWLFDPDKRRRLVLIPLGLILSLGAVLGIAKAVEKQAP